MMRLPVHVKTALFLVLLLATGSLSRAQEDPLELGFREPPIAARARCFWWWLNGNVTRDAITRDLEQMKAKGFGGALIFDADGSGQRDNEQVPAGPLFGSPDWRALFRHALDEAARLGLELSLNIQSGWNLGGPNVTPEEAAKQIVWAEARLEGPYVCHLQLPKPDHRGGYYRDICVLAYPVKRDGGKVRRLPIRDLEQKAAYRELGGSAPDCRPLLNDSRARDGEEDAAAGAIVDLSAHVTAEGRLAWEVPEGDWVVLRFGYTITGEQVSTASGGWQGLVIDYMSQDVLRAYWERHVRPLLETADIHCGAALKYLHTDSWECGGMNWTPGFAAEFRQRRGYDLKPYLPVIAGRIVNSRDASNRFLADFRKTIGDCVAENHYAVLAALAHQHGLTIHPESGGPHAGPFDALKCLGRSDVPMSEFWAPSPHRPDPENRFFVKQAASATHIYGRNIVAAEGFTSIGPHWDEILWRDAKPSFDHEACAGLNLTFVHTFTCSPLEMGLPGQEYFAGTHFNPNVTWWEKAGAFVGYLNRVQFLLQQGRFVADVCYYYGDHVPNLARLQEADPAGALPGYDYDVINEEVLCSGLEVRAGRIVLPSGMAYRILALPGHRLLSISAIRVVHALVHAGAIVLGEKPLGAVSLTGYPASEEEFQRLADAVWGEPQGSPGEHTLGSGKAVWGKPAREVLRECGIAPDCEFPDAATGDAAYVHRRTEGADLFFVANQREQAAVMRAVFRVADRSPEIWDPVTGKRRRANVFEQGNGRTTVPLEFGPYGSCFVVFRETPPGSEQEAGGGNWPALEPIGELKGAWTVHFDPAWGGPEQAVFDTLVSWTERPEEGIRHYAGAAVYRKAFQVPAEALSPSARVGIDLGGLSHMASVRVNGQDLGVLWTPPFFAEITAAVRSGTNELEIEVINNWTNRLVGDAALPPDQRLTHTNILRISPDTPLAPSGLFGPVRLLRIK